VRFAALQSVDMHAACSSIGFPTPVTFSPFPTESTVPDRLPSPDLLRNQVHPLVSFAPLCSPPSPCLPAAFRPQAPSMGLPSLIAASPTSVVTMGSHAHRLPSSAFLTPSTASSAGRLVGLFHPTATSRVHSSGVHPSPAAGTPRRCPVPSRRFSPNHFRQLPDYSTIRRAALRALFRVRVRYESLGFSHRARPIPS
jgi:hypothetical protein